MFKVKYLSKYLFSAGILLIILMKFHFANTGFLNFEGLFFELARQLNNHYEPLKNALYFEFQANPIGTSLIISVFYQLFEALGASVGIIGRAPSILGLIPTAYILRKFIKHFLPDLNSAVQVLIVFLILLHPSIWAISGRAFSDSFYVIFLLSIYGIYFRYSETKLPNKALIIICSLVFLSLLVKVNTLMLVASLGVCTAFDIYRRNASFRVKDYLSDRRLWIALSGLAALLCYYLIATNFLFPFRQNNDVLLQLSLPEAFRNIVLYNLHFFIMTLPFSLFVLFSLFKQLNHRRRVVTLGFSTAVAALFFVFFQDANLFNTGELNFGSALDAIFFRFYWVFAPPLIILALIQFWAMIVKVWDSQTKGFELSLLLSFIGLILLHSLVKPVQRYLVILIFFQIVYFFYLYRGQYSRIKNFGVIAMIFIYLVADLALSTQNKVKSDAYLKMGQAITAENKYSIYIVEDEERAHLFGNLPEEFLLPNESRQAICVYSEGYVKPEIAYEADASSFIQVKVPHPFLKSVFKLNAKKCI